MWLRVANTVMSGVLLGVAVLVGADLWQDLDGRQAVAQPEAAGDAPSSSVDGLLVLDGTRGRGSSGAPVGVLVFSPIRCPLCAKLSSYGLPSLDDYVDSGEVLVSFRHFFWEGRERGALAWARGTECAGRQDAFWAMQNQLAQSASVTSADSVFEVARALNLDIAALRDCLESRPDAAIDADLREGSRHGIWNTPTVFVGRVRQHGRALQAIARLQGEASLEQLRSAVEAALRAYREETGAAE